MARKVQDFIPIDEIRDGVVILKTGEFRAVLMCSTVNFDLKSPDEQEAILLQYQNFLNSLDFPIQIFIQSRKLDIRPYIAALEERIKQQTNDLLKIQTREYADFIKTVTEQTNVMKKYFFVVVSYTPNSLVGRKAGGGGGLLSGLFGSKKKQGGKARLEEFEEQRSQLEQRIAIVTQGLGRVGIRPVALGTEELVELFYKIFNPGELSVPTLPQNQ